MIYFRPHHFLCTLGFRGKGYSDAFVRNFSRIVQQLRSPEGASEKITVIFETDHICKPCPNRRSKLCVEQEKIEKLDQAHAHSLNLKEGDVLTWQEAKERINQRIDEETFDQICSGCSWKDLGFCREALRELKTQSSTMPK